MSNNPFLSVVIPVYNGGSAFVTCLTAINHSSFKDWELIVVDDGSTDQSAVIAAQLGATVLQTNGRLGPGAARNLGAQTAKGEFLCFIDADCESHPDTLMQIVRYLELHSEVDALFGSYDDAPQATSFVAQYKNLFHHYVHQTGHEEASTFWAGCGVVRRSTFLKLGGFDVQRYPRPSIEDIDLGYRIRQAGGKIRLAKQVHVKHHKAWTLSSLIKTDVCDRGIPWTRLILNDSSGFINDLNLKNSSRLSVVLVYILPILLVSSFYRFEIVFLFFLVVSILLILNFDVYYFFFHKRGIAFAISSVLMHWLYYFYSGIAFALGHFIYRQEQMSQRLTSIKILRKLLKQFSQQV